MFLWSVSRFHGVNDEHSEERDLKFHPLSIRWSPETQHLLCCGTSYSELFYSYGRNKIELFYSYGRNKTEVFYSYGRNNY